jgi:hypothetical protein
MVSSGKVRVGAVVAGAAALVGVAAGAASASKTGPVGTWSGRIVQSERTYTKPSVTLVITAHGLLSRFHGLTGAAHDSPTATSTCSVPYKLVGQQDGWFYYEQSGPSQMATPTSAVEGAPCGAVGKRKPGWAGYLLRLHPPQGGKLAVQITTWDQPPKTLADTVSMLKRPLLFWRGYLNH